MMKNIPNIESPIWAEVPYVETTDRIIGGISGVSNASALALHERTEYLKEAITDLSVGTGAILTDLYGDINLHGNTFTNMRNATAPSDPITLQQLENVGTASLGYTIPEEGGIPRFLSSKLQESVSVRDFGALGDGVTDDTAAIQVAINAAKGTGKVLYIPSGSYKLSTTGTVSSVAASLVPYALLIDAPLNIECDGTLMIPISDANRCNAVVFNAVSDGSFSGGYVTGYDLNNATTRLLYSGVGVLLNNCSNVVVDRIKVTDTRGGAVMNDCINCTIKNSRFSRTVAASAVHSGSAFAVFGGSGSRIKDCYVHGGTFDGDIGAFGTGNNNHIEGCHVHNYKEGDTTKEIVLDTNQGICIDSDQNNCSVKNCYAYGYFYGIDVKTNVANCEVSGNLVERNKVGISCRRGEGNASMVTARITNNSIIPGNGNGNTYSIGGHQTIGIYLQDVTGPQITSNFIGVTFSDSIQSQNWCGIFGVCDSSTISQDQGIQITDNMFAYCDDQGGRFRTNTGPFIHIIGTDNNTIIISDNMFQPYSGIMSSVGITLSDFGSVSICGNSFSEVANGSSNADMVSITDCLRLEFSGNDFKTQATALSVSGGDLTVVNSNVFGAGAGSDNTKPTIVISDSGGLVVNGNALWVPTSPPYRDGQFLVVTTQVVENLIFTNNLIRISNFTPSNYYSLNGTTNKTGSNIVVNNVVFEA